MQVQPTIFWNQRAEASRNQLNQALSTISTNEGLVDQVKDYLAYANNFFYEKANRPAQDPTTYNNIDARAPLLVANPYFWGGGFYRKTTVTQIHIGNNYSQSSWFGGQNTLVTSSSSSSSSRKAEKEEKEETAEQKKNRHAMYAAVATAAIALASIGTFLATAYYWILPTADDAYKASKNNAAAQRAGNNLMNFFYQDPLSLRGTGPRTEKQRLSFAGKHIAYYLQEASTADKSSKMWRAMSWGSFAVATTGTVHATISAIALLALSESLTATASVALLDLAAFCTVSCSLPILCALGAIALFGMIALKISQVKGEECSEAAFRGLGAFDHLNTLLSIPSAPPAQTMHDRQPAPQGTAPPTTYHFANLNVNARPPATAPGHDSPPDYDEAVSQG